MSINIGNNNIGEIYVGSSVIGEIYKGSELVYKSGPSLKLYGTTFDLNENQANGYLVGSWSTEGVLMPSRVQMIITSISGTLGASGSKISAETDDSSLTIINAVYDKTFTINGINVYLYYKYGNILSDYALVMENSEVESIILYSIRYSATNPSSVTTTTATGGGFTHTKDASGDATWYLNGIR